MRNFHSFGYHLRGLPDSPVHEIVLIESLFQILMAYRAVLLDIQTEGYLGSIEVWPVGFVFGNTAVETRRKHLLWLLFEATRVRNTFPVLSVLTG